MFRSLQIALLERVERPERCLALCVVLFTLRILRGALYLFVWCLSS